MTQKTEHGVTILELLVVISIIGILVLISVPNIIEIIAGHRLRRSANDFLIKARSARSLAISKRRQIRFYIDRENHLLKIDKVGYTEYNLLEDIAEVISTAESEAKMYANLTTVSNNFVLFKEEGEILDDFLPIGIEKQWVTDDNGIIIGQERAAPIWKSGLDAGFAGITSTCAYRTFHDNSGPYPSLVMEPSGMFSETCSVTLRGSQAAGRQSYDITFFKGGQIILR